MLELCGEFKSLEWRGVKKGQGSQEMFLLVKVAAESKSMDVGKANYLSDVNVHVEYANIGSLVNIDGKIKSIKPEDAELLLRAPDEEQCTIFTLEHPAPEVYPGLVGDLVALVHEPEQRIVVRISGNSSQTNMFQNGSDGPQEEA